MSDTSDMERIEDISRFIDTLPAIAVVWFGEFVMDTELPEKTYTVINRWGNA